MRAFAWGLEGRSQITQMTSGRACHADSDSCGRACHAEGHAEVQAMQTAPPVEGHAMPTGAQCRLVLLHGPSTWLNQPPCTTRWHLPPSTLHLPLSNPNPSFTYLHHAPLAGCTIHPIPFTGSTTHPTPLTGCDPARTSRPLAGSGK